MNHSTTTLLTLHSVRLLGNADTGRVAARFGLDHHESAELLLDFEAYGWVRQSAFAGQQGWSLTDPGKQENERQLAAELAAAGARSAVVDVHKRFLPLNSKFQHACTRWQIRPVAGDSLSANDHTDHRWDDRVIAELGSLGRRLTTLQGDLNTALPRFMGYSERYDAAYQRVAAGERRWVDDVGIDSCHAVWFELHEDLLASLGLARGKE